MPRQLDITEFHVFRDYIREACGLYLNDEHFERVSKVVGARMSELGLGRFSEYQRVLTSAGRGHGELTSVAALMTVGETHLFRNAEHWRAFEECVVPWIVERARTTDQRCLRIWSAGCSTGEEAYTASMVLSRSLPDFERWSIDILGTDLNPAAISTARKAMYTEHSFRGVTAEIKNEYFENIDGGWYRPRPRIRERVRFQEMNLLDAAATAGMRDIDVIFCRNVLIYFDPPGIENALAAFRRSLRMGGYLFLGHAESRHGNQAGFASLNVCNTFIFKPIPQPSQAGGDGLTAGLDCSTEPKCSVEPLRPIAERQLTPTRTNRPAMAERANPGVAPDRTNQPAGAPDRTDESAVPGPTRPRDRADASPALERRVSPAQEPEATPPSLDVLRAQAVGHLCAEEDTRARLAFERILKRVPGDAESLLGVALILGGAGNVEAALQRCRHVLDVHPMSAEAYVVMALVHEGIGDDVIAQRELEKAIYLDNRFSIAHFRLARVHDRAGRHDDAMREFNNTLDALPDDDDQRLRVYSGGFDKEIVAQICEQRLGIESATVQRVGSPACAAGSSVAKGVRR